MTDGELAAAADALVEVPPSWTRVLKTGRALLSEVRRLRLQLERDARTYATMQKGMESQAELMDGLKQTERETARMASGVSEHNAALEMKVSRLEAENAGLLSMLPDDAGRGDRDAQAKGWSAVWAALWAAGMDRFLVSLTGSGMGRAVGFVRHLAAENARLRALLAAHGHDPGRCGEFPEGEQCALPFGHAGPCKWAGGD